MKFIKSKKKNQDHYTESLRQEMLYLIERELSPLALKYGYSDIPLESKVRWKPIVLILGNYSSGKSTLINDTLGASVQLTGQAPTDDSFTVITGCSDDEIDHDKEYGAVVEDRGGKVLLQDKKYPFEELKKHGERFASHFRYKKVNSSALKDFAIIDTPGMLDSVSEKDRGYDYQQVIGDLAEIADLVLVLFDPHKAGTVRESHASLRQTLPEATFEDRLIFVLNRIDECGSLEDLLRVYGTLCWNLSQMTGRKDIPRILLTYANSLAGQESEASKKYLNLFSNQKDDLQKAIKEAPKHRLDHMVGYLEYHSFRLSHLLEGLSAFYKKRNTFGMKCNVASLAVSCLFVMGMSLYMDLLPLFDAPDFSNKIAVAGASVLVLFGLFKAFVYSGLMKWYELMLLQNIDELTDLSSQSRRDSWAYVKDTMSRYILKREKTSLNTLRRELDLTQSIYNQGAQDVRHAISELS